MRRVLGDVASWLDINTRKATIVPAAPRSRNHSENTQRTIRLFISDQALTMINTPPMSHPHVNGVAQAGVGGNVASGRPSLITLVALTSLRPSAILASPAWRIISKGTNISSRGAS